MPQRYAQWKIASMYVTTRQNQRFADTSPEVVENDDSVSVTYTYYMPTTPQSSCKVAYKVFGDGTIETTLSYDPVKELGDMPEFGMMFKLIIGFESPSASSPFWILSISSVIKSATVRTCSTSSTCGTFCG